MLAVQLPTIEELTAQIKLTQLELRRLRYLLRAAERESQQRELKRESRKEAAS
jgi:hypothetical protein